MLFGGAGATVYAAQDSMPNDSLYAVKTWSEDVKLGLTSDPAAKSDLLESYLYRRFAELDTLLADGETIPDDFVTRTQDQLKAMGDSVAQMDKNTDPTQIQDRDRVMTNSPCVFIDDDGDGIDDIENTRVPDWALLVCEQLRAMEQRSTTDECLEDGEQGCKGVPLEAERHEMEDLGGNGPGPAGDDTLVPPIDGTFGPREYCTTDEFGAETCAPVGGPNTVPVAPQTSPSDNYQNQGDSSQQGSGSGTGTKP
jgi:hypothetical protein